MQVFLWHQYCLKDLPSQISLLTHTPALGNLNATLACSHKTYSPCSKQTTLCRGNKKTEIPCRAVRQNQASKIALAWTAALLASAWSSCLSHRMKYNIRLCLPWKQWVQAWGRGSFLRSETNNTAYLFWVDEVCRDSNVAWQHKAETEEGKLMMPP